MEPNITSLKVAVSIVNLNCLEHTKNLISDLDRQLYSNYTVYLYDQGSTERGTKSFLTKVAKKLNYVVVENGENKPLNHIWNDFANEAKSKGFDVLTFLNNDIRIPSNYLTDTINVLGRDKRVGIAIHATNNKDYSTATSPTRHIFETAEIKQGWEFSIRSELWKDIPPILKFYCGDDFIFQNVRDSKSAAGVITSSPVIHKLSQTREAMGEDFTKSIKEQALLDIENYKKLGFKHLWNNITKHSRIEQQLKQIVEISVDLNICTYSDYQRRLTEHLQNVSNIEGNFVDLGVNDIQTFELIMNHAIAQNKQLVGIDSTEYLSKDIISNTSRNRPAEKIRVGETLTEGAQHFTIRNKGILWEVENIDYPVSFAFVGCFNPVKLRTILPYLWDSMAIGGVMFFPYYHYETCPSAAEVIDEFLASKKHQYLTSRVQTAKGVRDTYLAVKCLKESIPYETRTKPLIVTAVLKTGGIYDETYVNKLASAVKRHLNVDYKFVCLTDSTDGVIDLDLVDEVIHLQYDLPGWWSKLELFRPEIFGDSQILYFDLDTLIVDNINDFASYGGDFFGLRDFNTMTGLSSGIMGWQSLEAHHIFYKFIRQLIVGDITIKQFIGGDQDAISHFIELGIQYVQDMFPNKMSPFKYDCYNENTGEVSIPEKTSVVCFHSKPKMADLENDPVIKTHWI